jgi:beta-glucosidase
MTRDNRASPGNRVSVRDFPASFLFGSSTAAHQVEGGNFNNDWWAWEHAPHTTCVESSGDAIDQWHRYRDDFALLAGLGQNAHRMSLEWSRIEPAPGEYSGAALEHYRRVLGTLEQHGLTAFVTLHHFTLPRWLAERGGWLAPDAVERFARYVERVAAALGDLMPFAGTINEPQIVALMGYRQGVFPPGLRNPTQFMRVTRRLIVAHRAAVAAVKSGKGDPQAGLCLQLPAFEPARPQDPACLAACAELADAMESVYLDELAGDWVGVQYYTRQRVDPAAADGFAPAPPGARLTQMGWEIHPEGLHRAIVSAARSGLPVYVTENGIATADDAQRAGYMRDHLAQVARALADGVDVRGFHYWSAFDNFEWAEGFRPTFGLIGIDREDGLRRVVRPSAHAYGELARTGSLSAFTGGESG